MYIPYLFVFGISAYTVICMDKTLTSNDDELCPLAWNDVKNGQRKCKQCFGRKRLTHPTGIITDGPGKYSIRWKCAWFITSDPPSPITFRINNISTECGWDHLYIHDGGSAYAPLRASYSGILRPGNSTAPIPDVATYSGKAYVHFYSDEAYNIDGFNLSYSTRGCLKPCSGNRVCKNTQCICRPGWTGADCTVSECTKSDCLGDECTGRPECWCKLNNTGKECERVQKYGYWTELSSARSGVALHRAVVVGQSMWVIGGVSFDPWPDTVVASRYDLEAGTWHNDIASPDATPRPLARYGHSLAVHKDSIYMYGGTLGTSVTSQLWRYNTATRTWTNMTYAEEPPAIAGTSGSVVNSSEPIGATGHTAHIIQNIMYVVLGYSPEYGYVQLVQEYDIDKEMWRDVSPTPTFIAGSYGHSSVYDATSRRIFVFGGHRGRSTTRALMSGVLHSYDPTQRTWRVHSRSGRPSYLQSAVISHGHIIVFGGNLHNVTSEMVITQCHSRNIIVYNIKCDTWHEMASPVARHESSLPRYGHSAILYDGEMYIHGGFTGVMLSDLHKLTLPDCSVYKTEDECKLSQKHTGYQCTWSPTATPRCSYAQYTHSSPYLTCPQFDQISFCQRQHTCHLCLSTAHHCDWVNDTCRVLNSTTARADVSKCAANDLCHHTYNCALCERYPGCTWLKEKCTAKHANETEKTQGRNMTCSPTCASYTSCDNCTDAECMWCSSESRCIDTNAYVPSYPYGKCMDWTTKNCSGSQCSDYTSCAACNRNPLCGWCNDPSDTGLGVCMPGGASGPKNASTCLSLQKHKQRWFFTECPPCQCNGHSICDGAGMDQCVLCGHNTTGKFCEICAPMYFGDAIQGGTCARCTCNQRANACDPYTGICDCYTRGVTGHHCNQCDSKNKYAGEGSLGKCYYILAIDYQYTFNMSKDDDKHYTQIIFKNTPKTTDRDVEFTLNCTGFARVNVTVVTKSIPGERLIAYAKNCAYFELKLEHSKYPFSGKENATFFVYVYDFKVPFKLMISFAQHSEIDLVKFFVTFFSCFLSLMLLAAAGWKIKQRYDLYRERRRLLVQMEKLANRPFSVINVEVEPRVEVIPISALAMNLLNKQPIDVKKRKKSQPANKPSPVATQPYKGTKTELATLLMRLPTGDEEYTPRCQSGLAFATALTYTGNPRKASVDGRPDKRRNKRQPQVASIPPAPPPQPSENIV